MLELIGTAVGAWKWAAIDPVLGLSQANFPSGVATESTMPYQNVTGGAALVLSGLRYVNAWRQAEGPPPHDFFGHTIGAYCPSVMEVFMAKSKAERGRFSSRKKMDVVVRVLRGDDLDLVSREAGITAAKVSEWRDQFVASGQAGLKSRADDGRADELARLKAMVGDLTMRLELSREAVQRLRGGTPLATGRSTR